MWHTNRNSTPSSFSLLSPIHNETSTALRGGCGSLGGEHAHRRLTYQDEEERQQN